MKNFFGNFVITIGNLFNGVLCILLFLLFGLTVMVGLIWITIRETLTLGDVGFEVCEMIEHLVDIGTDF